MCCSYVTRCQHAVHLPSVIISKTTASHADIFLNTLDPGGRSYIVSCELQDQRVYEKLRVERMNAKRDGMRKKRAADAAAAEKEK